MNPKPFTVSLPPHIRSAESMMSRTGQIAASLSPLIVLAAVLFHIEYLKIFSACALAAVFVQAFSYYILKNKKLFDFSDISFVLLLSLILSPKIPFLAAFTAALAGLFFSKKCFGGSGAALFHPALLAYALISFYAPDLTSGNLASLIRFEKFYQGAWIFVIGGIFFISGILMLIQRLEYWEVPLIYFGAVYVCSRFWLGEAYPWAWLCFISFFILSDDETTPVTRNGMRIFAAAAALLTLAVSRAVPPGLSAVFSVLIMNGLNPAIDALIVPAAIGSQVPVRNLIESESHVRE